MKIKDIFIEAFRCFDYQSLDFEIDEGRLANMIVLYAPNGFGKTSLFDAIEFGVTGSVSRFKKGVYDKDNKEDKKLRNVHSFLFNKNVDEKRKIRIAIHFDGTFEDIDKSFDAKNENFLSSSFVSSNDFFKNVILSQEWFDYFIRSTTPEDRCKIFFDYFGGKDDLLAYNKKLEESKSELKSVKTKLERHLKALQDGLKKEVKEDAFVLLQEELDKFSKSDWQLPSYDRLTVDSLQALLVWEKAKEKDLYFDISSSRKKLEAIQEILSGTSELVTMEELGKLLSRREVLKIKLQKINDYLLKQNRLFTITKKYQANVDAISKIKKEKNIFEFYVANENKISALYVRLWQMKEYEKNNQVKVKQLNEQIESLYKENGELLKKKLDAEKNLSSIKAIYENLDSLYHEYSENISKKKTQSQVLKFKETQVSELQDSNEVLAKKIKTIELFGRNLQQGLEDSLLSFNLYSDRVISLLDSKKRLLEIEKEKSDIDNKKKGHELYKNEVQRLVDNSRTIYSELENGVCPLCGFDWKSVESLIGNIENNRVLDDAILQFSCQYDKLSEEGDSVQKTILDKKNELFELVKREILNRHKQIGENEFKIGNLKKEILETHNNLDALEKSISKYADRFRDYECPQIKELVSEEYNKCQGLLSEVIKKISVNSKSIESYNNQIRILLNKVETQRGEYAKILVDGFYMKTQDCYLHLASSFDTGMLLSWKDKISELDNSMKHIDDNQKAIKCELENLHNDGVTEYDHDAKVNEQKLMDAEYKDVMSQNGQFVNAVNRLLSAKISVDSSKVAVEKLLHQEYDKLHSITEMRENLFKQLERLSILIENAKEYFGYNQKKVESEKVREAIDEKKEQLNLLQKEKERLSAYVKDYVDKFFDKELINKLYNTIDPHPKYKKINFDCDFDKQTPRLFVKMGTVKDSDGEIVPNLYFSSAQINILSFCIFMAKALNVKYKNENVDCIFIDDPIQAMDDINILSVVDLLRNVAFGNNKQVVITTHDRNFYELLKKKCPSYIFDSKFFKFQEKGLIVEDD